MIYQFNCNLKNQKATIYNLKKKFINNFIFHNEIIENKLIIE